MIADGLRRQADVFTDLVELQPKLGRGPAACFTDAYFDRAPSAVLI
jgi:hypothetical protein